VIDKPSTVAPTVGCVWIGTQIGGFARTLPCTQPTQAVPRPQRPYLESRLRHLGSPSRGPVG
jgi:hypothetical protein